MIERELSIKISIESIEIKSLFFVDGALDSISLYDMKIDEKKHLPSRDPQANYRHSDLSQFCESFNGLWFSKLNAFFIFSQNKLKYNRKRDKLS